MDDFLGHLWTLFDAGSIALEAVYTGILSYLTLEQFLSKILGHFFILLNCHPGQRHRRPQAGHAIHGGLLSEQREARVSAVRAAPPTGALPADCRRVGHRAHLVHYR